MTTDGTSALQVQPRPTGIISRSLFTLTAEQVDRLKLLAQMLATSKLAYGQQRVGEGDLFIVMLKGIELGLEPMAAMDMIQVIQGKPTLAPQGMLALVNQSGELEDIVINSDEKQCVVTMKRKGRTPHTETFTLADAAAMQLSGKDNYKKQPKVMLKWRAVSACARVVFPDIIQGLYTPEELNPDLVYADDETVVQPVPQPAPKLDALPAPEQPQLETPTPQAANGMTDAQKLEELKRQITYALEGVVLREDEIAHLAGITDFHNMDEWRAIGSTAKAVKLVQENYDANVLASTSPAQPKNKAALDPADEELALWEWTRDTYDVTVKPHFNNLVKKLTKEGKLADGMTLQQKQDVIAAHYAEKNGEGRPSGMDAIEAAHEAALLERAAKDDVPF